MMFLDFENPGGKTDLSFTVPRLLRKFRLAEPPPDGEMYCKGRRGDIGGRRRGDKRRGEGGDGKEESISSNTS